MEHEYSEAISHLSKDPSLVKAIESVSLAEIEIHNDIYFDLLESIVSQQLSVKAAATIFGRFLELFPEKNPSPDAILALDIDILRSSGLSGQKA